MKISVIYCARLRSVTGVSREVFEVGETCPLQEVTNQVIQRRGELASGVLLDGGNTLQRGILVCVNDEQVDPRDTRILHDGDSVTFMSPISGG